MPRTVGLLSCLILGGLIALGQTPNTASVSGVVYRVGTSSAIAGVNIRFRLEGAPPPEFTPGAKPHPSVVTGENGRFSIKDLPPGRYVLELEHPGFLPPSIGPKRLTLEANQQLPDVRLALIGAGEIGGRVLNDEGIPLAGVDVSALRPRFEQGRWLMSACSAVQLSTDRNTSRTDDRGIYRITNLRPGSYYIAASSGACTGTVRFHPDTADTARAVPITLHPGEIRTGIDFSVSSQIAYTIGLKLAPPLPTALNFPIFLQAIRRDDSGFETIFLMQEVSKSALPKGESYETPALPSGTYDFYYTSGLGLPDIGHLQVHVSAGTSVSGTTKVDGGTIVVRPRIPVRGQLRPTGGVILQQSSVPSQNLRVQLLPVEGERFGLLPFPFISVKPDGTFENLTLPGKYQIAISGPPDLYIVSARYKGQDVLDDGLRVDSPDPTALLDLTVGTGGTIEGVVRNSLGETVSDAQVVLVPPLHRRANTTLFRTAISGENGRFLLRGVPPGDYGILAWVEVETNAWHRPDFLKAVEVRATRASVRAGLSTGASVGVIQATN